MWTIGDTFWLPYLKIQIWGRALEHSTPTEVLYRTIKHGLLYAGALLYYSLPWGLGGILYGFLQLRSKILTRENIFTHTRPLMFICTAGAFVLSFPFSVFARVSVRYIYSAYYLLAILGFLLVFQPLKTYVRDHTLAGRYRVNDVLTLAVIIWTVSKIGAVFLETS